MKNNWNSLDNAAKIFPSAGRRADTQVFRFFCELFENIDPVILQKALDRTMEEFEVFRCVLKRGFFWYYLETTDIAPIVRQEYKKPCAPIYCPDSKKLLFQVTYYGSRINFEVYHVLTDGTGAVNFLKTLITRYLSEKNGIDEPPTDYKASSAQMENDSFKKYYTGKSSKLQKKIKRAYRIRGARLPYDGMRVITGFVSSDALLSAAHRYGGTATAFICAALIKAIGDDADLRALKRPVAISIPVNLRKYFKSDTARNFFGIIKSGCDLSEPKTLAEIVRKVDADIKYGVSPEAIMQNVNAYSAAEHNLFARIAPLALKDFVLKIAYDLSMLESSATVSNIGVVKLPDEIKKDVRLFGFSAGTDKVQACVTGFNGGMTISFTSPFISTDIPRLFFRTLVEEGIGVEITANSPDEEFGYARM